MARGILILVSLWSSTAAAADGVRLVYERGRGAQACADEAAVRAAVADELHRDPFDEGAAATLAASLRAVDGRIRARIELRDGAGALVGVRELSGRDCAELVPAVAWVMALAIASRAAAPPPVETFPPTEIRASSESSPSPPPLVAGIERPAPTPHAVAWNVSAGVLGAFGAAPAPAMGFDLAVAMVRRRWSLGVEIRWDLPARATAAFGGEAETSLIVGVLAPCVRHRVVAVCALAELGAERGAGAGYANPQVVNGFYAALGGRLAIEMQAFGPLWLRASADLLAPLTRLELYVGTVDKPDRRVYRTANLSSALGLAMMVHIQ